MNVIKTAEHLTRRSFKRKIVAVGVSIFSALALFATGFASWVISSDATREGQGNIQVGVVADKSITIENVALNVNTISFNPAAGDVAVPNTVANPEHTAENGYGGRVYTDNDKTESLSVTITANITGYENISDLRIWLEIPAPVRATAAATASRVIDSDTTETGKYILLPICAQADNNAGVKLIEDGTKATMNKTAGQDGYWTLTDEDGDGTYAFTYTFSFAWGDFFGNMNPSLYYDIAEADGGKKSYPGYKASEEIEAFRRMMFGISDDDQYAQAGDNAGTFKIVVEAKAAEGN